MTKRLLTKGLFCAGDLTIASVLEIFDVARKYVNNKHPEDILRNKLVLNLFFENSTRTRVSFEIAAKKLAADVINMSADGSSLAKGESFKDTCLTLAAYEPDFVVMRHKMEGASKEASGYFNCPILNAGDGTNEHPTQGLLDAFTIMQKKGRIEGLKIAICGDILHSRVARSNITMLKLMGADVHLIAPEMLLPKGSFGLESHDELWHGIKDADVVMMLRNQYERMEPATLAALEDIQDVYRLDYEKLKYAKPDVIVMHPGPINRGVEIDGDLADDKRYSVILNQVAAGLAVRSAIFDILK